MVNYSQSEEAADKVVKAIRDEGGEAVALKADMKNRDEIGGLFAQTQAKLGPVDILVNNAGVYRTVPLEAIDERHFREEFDLNVLGVIYATQEAVKQFGDRGGNVINISSVVAQTTSPAELV